MIGECSFFFFFFLIIQAKWKLLLFTNDEKTEVYKAET